MPITLRDGTKLENKIEYYGDWAHRNSTLPGQRKKKKPVSIRTRQQKAKQRSPPTLTLPSTPPAPQPAMILRQKDKKAICSSYGSSREALYPGYHFCSPCRMFDNDMLFPHMNKKIKRTSRAYKCTAKHTCHAYPTQTTADYRKTRAGKRGSKQWSSPKKKRRVRAAPYS